MAIDDPDNWSYYSELNINNPSPDYQMRLVLKRGTGTNDPTKGIIYDGGNCSYDDMRDVRVGTDSDPATAEQLPQWAESVDPGIERIIWVKTNGNQTLYLFIGNSNASEYSDGNNTFIIFNDGSSMEGWTPINITGSTTWVVNSGKLRIYADDGRDGGVLYCDTTTGTDNYAINAIIITQDGLVSSNCQQGFRFDNSQSSGDYPRAYRMELWYHCWAINGTGGAADYVSSPKDIDFDASLEHKYEFRKDGTNWALYVDDDLKVTKVNEEYNAQYVGLYAQIYSAGHWVDFYNVFVRKYTITEPTWDSFGEWQEISPPPPPPPPSGGLSDIDITPARVITTDFPAAAGLPKNQKIRVYAKAVSGQEKEIILDALT